MCLERYRSGEHLADHICNLSNIIYLSYGFYGMHRLMIINHSLDDGRGVIEYFKKSSTYV